MSAINASYVNASAPAQSNAAPVLPLLSQMPALLEYRGESDPDGDFIVKTVIGFTAGLMAAFMCLELGQRLLFNRTISMADQANGMVIAFAAMCGISAVASSLLLVGLKVRSDHVNEPLFARHWLNSISTGAVYSAMIWLPFTLELHSFHFNRYVMSGLCMLLLAFPAIASLWIIAPHPHYSTSTRSLA